MKTIVAVLDTGCSLEYKEKNEIYRYSFEHEVNDDSVGHGTAVLSLIDQRVENCIIYSISFTNNKNISDNFKLARAIHWTVDNVKPDVINISSGVKTDSYEYLKKAVIYARSKQVVVVCAAENSGNISYPAYYSESISVMWSDECTGVHEFNFLDNQWVNILGFGGILKVPWKNMSVKNVSGSSFSTPLITAQVVKIIQEKKTKDIDLIKKYLKKKSFENVKNDYEYTDILSLKENISEIKKAIIFPLNKEMTSILGNQDLINFEIVGIFEPPFSLKIGRYLEEIIFGFNFRKLKVQSIMELNWDEIEFDTIIVGHIEKVSSIYKTDFYNYIKEKCLYHKKKVFFLDEIQTMVPKQSFENKSSLSLFSFQTPSVAIIGTSPQQGKLNLQHSLYRELLNIGYSIGRVGTEPTSLLYGMNFMYHYGYSSKINSNYNEEIFYINHEMKMLDQRNFDLIIIGTQSQLVPYSFGNLGFYPLNTTNLLLATQPDAYILSINLFDSFSYIERTIR